MIEPTDEMRDVFLATQTFELNRGASEACAVRRALTAVLAIVERDYQVSPQPKGWLLAHVDHHDGARVDGCTFCPAAPREAGAP